jgi:outer membrane protein TolC
LVAQSIRIKWKRYYIRLDQDVTLSLKQIEKSSNASLGALNKLGSLTSTMTERDIFSSSIRAVWPIFTGGRITAAQTAAEGKKEEAQSQLAMVIQARYEDLAKYYYSVVLAKEVLNTRIAVEQGLTQHRDNAPFRARYVTHSHTVNAYLPY